MTADLHKKRFIAAALAVLLAASFMVCAGCAQVPDDGAMQAGDAGSGRSAPAQRVERVPAIKYEEPAGDESLMPETGDAAGSADELLVRFLDVGQGDSALITLGEHSMLIDGGPSSASSELFSILTRLGITHLDCIIATHPDADHCGGLAGALNAVSCGNFYC